ncbi:hypothetical protein [Stappia indica]|uniref:hypothetical protein n=1 Tax=Stappia indica TaxID=538381 RepID=UPI001CD5DFF0|nr:hypothetical protein [Stappia indica]MCA1298106.1 hypothetical protein [Stappia indica]
MNAHAQIRRHEGNGEGPDHKLGQEAKQADAEETGLAEEARQAVRPQNETELDHHVVHDDPHKRRVGSALKKQEQADGNGDETGCDDLQLIDLAPDSPYEEPCDGHEGRRGEFQQQHRLEVDHDSVMRDCAGRFKCNGSRFDRGRFLCVQVSPKGSNYRQNLSELISIDGWNPPLPLL